MSGWEVVGKALNAAAMFADWRTTLRRLKSQPLVDVVFISNLRDGLDREIYFKGQKQSEEVHTDVVRNWLNGFVAGRTRAINLTTEEIWTIKGRRQAKKYFISAVEWAEKQGAKVILLAANTKRLFEGEDAEELKKKFPKLLFTIGDNGTFLLLKQESMRALRDSGLKPGLSRIAVLGPYGFLGEMMTKTLVNLGYNVIGAGPNEGYLENVAKRYGIETCLTFKQMGKVDAVIACTHSEKIRLDAEAVYFIKKEGRKLLVVDVATPPNLIQSEYEKFRPSVLRQDAGCAYAPGLKYVLGAIAYRTFRHTRGRTFGCFAEAFALASALNRGEEWLRNFDWMKVDDQNMEVISQMFKQNGFRMPPVAQCYGKPVRLFDLNLGETDSFSRLVRGRGKEESHSVLKGLAHKLGIL